MSPVHRDFGHLDLRVGPLARRSRAASASSCSSMASVTSASACSSRGIHRSLIARSRYLVASASASTTRRASAAAACSHRRGERNAVGLPRSGERRPVPGGGDGDDARGAGGVPDAHADGVRNGHVGDQAIGGQPDGPLAAEHRSPQQPPFGLSTAAVPFLGGLRRGLVKSAEFLGKDPELVVPGPRAGLCASLPGLSRGRSAPARPGPLTPERRSGQLRWMRAARTWGAPPQGLRRYPLGVGKRLKRSSAREIRT